MSNTELNKAAALKEFDRIIDEAKVHSDALERDMPAFEQTVKDFVERHSENNNE